MSTFSIIVIGLVVTICLILITVSIAERYKYRLAVDRDIIRLEELKTKWCIYTTDVNAYHIQAYYINTSGKKMYLGYQINPYAVYGNTIKTVGFTQDSTTVDQNLPLDILMQAITMCISNGFVKSR